MKNNNKEYHIVNSNWFYFFFQFTQLVLQMKFNEVIRNLEHTLMIFRSFEYESAKVMRLKIYGFVNILDKI